MLDYRQLPNLRTAPVERSLTPEIMLWTEVLLVGLADAVGKPIRTHHPSEQDQRQAMLWIQSRCDAVGSFCWTCEALRLDPYAVRKAALKPNCARNRGNSEMEAV